MEEGKGEEGPGCEGVAERERYVDVVAKKGFLFDSAITPTLLLLLLLLPQDHHLPENPFLQHCTHNL